LRVLLRGRGAEAAEEGGQEDDVSVHDADFGLDAAATQSYDGASAGRHQGKSLKKTKEVQTSFAQLGRLTTISILSHFL
jgi:hypothetical protein